MSKNRPIELSTSIQFNQMKCEKPMRFANSPAFKLVQFNLELPEEVAYLFQRNL